MPRSIAESITALENARNDIVDALNSKIEGGGIEKTLKISEVAEKINSIEVGGDGDAFECTFNSIDFYWKKDDPSPKFTFPGSTVSKNYYYQGIKDMWGYEKVVFDISVKNVINNFTGTYSKDMVILLEGLKNNGPEIETSGTIENGSGNIQVTITYDSSQPGQNNGYWEGAIFLFGNKRNSDSLNSVHFGYYAIYN